MSEPAQWIPGTSRPNNPGGGSTMPVSQWRNWKNQDEFQRWARDKYVAWAKGGSLSDEAIAQQPWSQGPDGVEDRPFTRNDIYRELAKTNESEFEPGINFDKAFDYVDRLYKGEFGVAVPPTEIVPPVVNPPVTPVEPGIWSVSVGEPVMEPVVMDPPVPPVEPPSPKPVEPIALPQPAPGPRYTAPVAPLTSATPETTPVRVGYGTSGRGTGRGQDPGTFKLPPPTTGNVRPVRPAAPDGYEWGPDGQLRPKQDTSLRGRLASLFERDTLTPSKLW